MIFFELDKQDNDIAEQICDLAEESIIVDEPSSFSSDLNEFIQVGVTFAPMAYSALVLIILELIRNKKHVRIKIGSFETEGVPLDKSIELAEKYIELKQDEKAKEELIEVLKSNDRR